MQATLDEQLIGTPFPTRPERSYTGDSGSRLHVSVVFTSEKATLSALQTASGLAGRLRAKITLIVPQVVSYQLPLNEPPVLPAWNENRLRGLALQVGVETAVRFYLCRDREETLARVLKPNSLVVIGGERRWWPTPERMLARRLRRRGHEVILTETE